MINKFKSIKNLAVFKEFDWNSSVKARNGVVRSLKKINILYGHNYSGKTTLSRIVRALETGVISDKYENPDFIVELDDNSDITPLNLTSHGKKVRVFNDDFIRENLRFIFNPDEDIESFAILGSDNNIIEAEIETMQKELGCTEEGKESGLYEDLKDALNFADQENKKYEKAKKELDEKLKKKALDRDIGIKYNSDRFGDQNYTTKKLEKDIQTILENNYQPPINDKIKELDKLLLENPKSPISSITMPTFSFVSLSEKAKLLVEKKISESDKIEELIKDAVLNRWVSEGRKHHKSSDKCAFCGNTITQGRWEKLEKHFDKESEKLEKGIDDLINLIENEKTIIETGFNPLKDQFYSEFYSKFDVLVEEYEEIGKEYIDNLNNITNKLIKRKNAIINTFPYNEYDDYSKDLKMVFDNYEILRKESNNYTNILNTKQEKAKKSLRLKEVYDFVSTINYINEVNNIKNLKNQTEEKVKIKEQLIAQIKNKESLIESKKRLLNDEEEGAKNVNKYLNDYFGHKFLSLQAIEKEIDDPENNKVIRFEVKRDGKKAHHLSEGECSLISFCYFIAKLEDINTKGQKPIIWIDDPISSLDGNHIFFLYSLIKSEIVDKNIFEQLFVSTHNLNFLKYLRRLSGGFIENGRYKSYEKLYLMIFREDKNSKILDMPKYLKEYATEFNYLFKQIYKCSVITEVTDKNYTTFYNFGNNARKFLEIYLYYKYPDETKNIEKLKKFFGNEQIPTILTDRINNEYSHLSAGLERGAIPVDAPEMKLAAKLIIQRIEILDIEQYNSLMNTIN